MNKKIKPPEYVVSILANRATDNNYYELAEGTNGKFRVNRLAEIPPRWGGEFSHCWVTLNAFEDVDTAFNYMQGLR